jgi:hypothetical protein
MIEERWKNLWAFYEKTDAQLDAGPNQKRNDLREWIEMFAAALWHLEMSQSLPMSLPEDSMRTFRQKTIDASGNVPWTLWMRQRNGLISEVRREQIVLTCKNRNLILQTVSELIGP